MNSAAKGAASEVRRSRKAVALVPRQNRGEMPLPSLFPSVELDPSSIVSRLTKGSDIKMPPRAPYIVPALKKHTATVIMAHGLGDRLVSSISHPNLTSG